MGKLKIGLLLLAMVVGCEPEAADPEPIYPAPAVEGIGAVILVDNSGSMDGMVRDNKGELKTKLAIAKEAVATLVKQSEDYHQRFPNQNLKINIIPFNGEVLAESGFVDPDTKALKPFIEHMTSSGSTAIGDSVVAAKRQLDKIGLKNRHVLIVTDGENMAGKSPEDAAAMLNALPDGRKCSVYLIAFDVNADKFSSLKGAGWMVLPAENATELKACVDEVLLENILLEK